MTSPPLQWQRLAADPVPSEFVARVRACVPGLPGCERAAQLLWQRGIREDLPGFLDAGQYEPTSPWDFGTEMAAAIARLQQARERGDRLAIWGDFDADGITATSVLWEGLGEFFPRGESLQYIIPNRLQDSHGLNLAGIERLAAAGVNLIVTCDTGSTNLTEIDRAGELGIDIIVTDHHTLPAERPNVTAIVNPRSFPIEHPLAHLSGVAVAYKLVEALYDRLPEIPQKPLEHLLDLVAIGLIADLVELKGDCRYLAQRGIARLRTQSQPQTATRPGILKLLELCKREGSRPTDISFGLGPRINAISRIHGDATFAVELLTGTDARRCNELALETELANTRRKGLQNELVKAVKQVIERLDLSTTGIILLEDAQWPGGILGLVAGQIAQEYGRPTILLAGDPVTGLARGSARSVAGIDLYELVRSQSHLLHRFGGHPFAAGLSLPLANISLFREAIDRELRQVLGQEPTATVTADLSVPVSELNRELFQELKLLEPCGMGNPVPKLSIENCWFEQVRNRNIEDRRGSKVRYIKTSFLLCDDTNDVGVRGHWWGHYSDEIPQDCRCDAIAELDYNSYSEDYEVRLLAVRPRQGAVATASQGWLLDWRGGGRPELEPTTTTPLELRDAPHDWQHLQGPYRQARSRHKPLALAYGTPIDTAPGQVWETLVGIAKYLSRTQESVPRERLREKLGVGNRALDLGLQALEKTGFIPIGDAETVQIAGALRQAETATVAIERFLAAIAEEQFHQQYFCAASVETLNAAIERAEPLSANSIDAPPNSGQLGEPTE